MPTVPSRKDKELSLTQQEGEMDNAMRGAASWISNGLRIEEQKYVLPGAI